MDTQTNNDAENGTRANINVSTTKNSEEYSYHLKTFQTSVNLLSHTLIGIVIGLALAFAFRSGLPIGPTPLHIVLCVLGYQLLMAQAILSLSPYNSWSAHLKVVDKRRAHWVLQVVGSALAISGSFIMISDKTIHWNSYHGIFGLIALIFTVVSLVNGLTSLYAYEFRKFIPGKLSKITHICFGIVAFGAACISLCYGFNKAPFRLWTGDSMAYTLIAFTATFTFLIIVAPFISFVSKFKTN